MMMKSLREHRGRIAMLGVALAVSLTRAGGGKANDGFRSSAHIEVTEVRIASKVSGRLAAIPVREGDQVSDGTLIAVVDTTDLVLARSVALADREQAAAEYRLRRNGARREDIGEARANVARGQADVDGGEKGSERSGALSRGGSVTEQRRDETRPRRDLARGRLEAARERLTRLENGSRSEEIDAALARLQAAEARLAQMAQQIADARVIAPTAGRITERLAEPGEVVPAGTPIALLSKLEEPWLTIYVAEPELPRLSLGQTIEVRSDDGAVRTGQVSFISSEAEVTPRNVQTKSERVKLVFRVKVALENRDGHWKPGMPAEARLPIGDTGRASAGLGAAGIDARGDGK